MTSGTDAVLGYSIDPMAVYGPSAAAVAGRNPLEMGTEEYAPLDGPARVNTPEISGKAAPNGLKHFFSSPAGLVLVLVPIAYVAFCKVYGS